jgi:alcohol dehydrogenase class IV
MRTISFLWPKKLVCGRESLEQCVEDLSAAGVRRVFFVTSKTTRNLSKLQVAKLKKKGIESAFATTIDQEPTIQVFERTLNEATHARADVVLGFGGGSVLDVAKLVAALLGRSESVRDVFGINLLGGRATRLVCLPTTSGTGSEVSPNSILLDEDEQLKKGVISPWLVPDATYIDPQLMVTMPPSVTAGTGMDALTHCIEAFTNKFAHPMVDLYALEGIRLISQNLPRAMNSPENLGARENMAIASMYGGVCLGPVNTAAVHALSYPLGGEYHVPHGLSNALLLPHVMEFNLSASVDRHAAIAVALGAAPASNQEDTARCGIATVRKLSEHCKIPTRLSDWKIPSTAIPQLAEAGMKVTRLLKNNPRELTQEDAAAIYAKAY